MQAERNRRDQGSSYFEDRDHHQWTTLPCKAAGLGVKNVDVLRPSVKHSDERMTSDMNVCGPFGLTALMSEGPAKRSRHDHGSYGQTILSDSEDRDHRQQSDEGMTPLVLDGNCDMQNGWSYKEPSERPAAERNSQDLGSYDQTIMSDLKNGVHRQQSDEGKMNDMDLSGPFGLTPLPDDNCYMQNGWSYDDPSKRPAKRNRQDHGSYCQTFMSDFEDRDHRQQSDEGMTNNMDLCGPLGLTPLMPDGNCYMQNGWSYKEPSEQLAAIRNMQDHSSYDQTIMSDFENRVHRQQSDEEMMNDMDLCGPLGLTPLMLDGNCYMQNSWSYEEPSERPAAKRNRQDLGSYDQTIMSDFEEGVHHQKSDEGTTNDMDLCGPFGLTPLMLDGNCYMQNSWSYEEPSERPAAKRNRQDLGSYDQTIMSDFEDGEHRLLTVHHLNAAEIKPSHILGALIPPQAEVTMNKWMTNDVNVRGPCGLTPLMLASFWGGGLEEGENLVIIQDLIAQGANINTQVDTTGETPLHLAARYARANAAKKLLDYGADANAQDNTGRTPLHTAVAANAQGVFQILLRHRKTDIDAKAYDGTTPLILAARLPIHSMVEELIQSDADINNNDNNGKSALHWAASVNNVDAVKFLLARGADKNKQDHKDETPLFLACLEGHVEAAKALLECGADENIADYMGCLPMGVAPKGLLDELGCHFKPIS